MPTRKLQFPILDVCISDKIVTDFIIGAAT